MLYRACSNLARSCHSLKWASSMQKASLWQEISHQQWSFRLLMHVDCGHCIEVPSHQKWDHISLTSLVVLHHFFFSLMFSILRVNRSILLQFATVFLSLLSWGNIISYRGHRITSWQFKLYLITIDGNLKQLLVLRCASIFLSSTTKWLIKIRFWCSPANKW